MKIIHFLWALDQGGAENLAVDLANEQSRDHEVVMLVANDKVDHAVKSRLLPAVRFVCVGRPAASKNPYWIAQLLLVIQALRPQIVHSHSDKLASLGWLIAAPLILTVHANSIRLSAQSCRFAAVCCISRAVQQDIHIRYPHLEARQVDNGINVSRIAVKAARPSPMVRGVQVSRLVHKTKGQDLLIKALAAINADSLLPTLTIDFIGEGSSLDYLVELAAELGVTEFCNFLGSMPRDKVHSSLCNYDILVQPSRDEGFGLTVAEGMPAGVAVIVSDIDGPMEVIGNGDFGHAFKTDDVSSLTATLRTVMSSMNTPAALAQLIAARGHVAAKYDLGRMSGSYVKIYNEIVCV